MKFEIIDWSVIRNTLITLMLSLSIGAGMVAGSLYFRSAMEEEYKNHNARFQSISRRYLAVDEEERLIQKYLPEFMRLYRRGTIGDERRLDWIEVLREAGRDINLPSLNYTIQPQTAYVPPYAINLSTYRLFSSTMQLNMQLLHEGDLFTLLDTLGRNAPGLFTVTSCRFSNHVSQDLLDDINHSNVSVECHLQWFTLKLANGQEIEV